MLVRIRFSSLHKHSYCTPMETDYFDGIKSLEIFQMVWC